MSSPNTWRLKCVEIYFNLLKIKQGIKQTSRGGLLYKYVLITAWTIIRTITTCSDKIHKHLMPYNSQFRVLFFKFWIANPITTAKAGIWNIEELDSVLSIEWQTVAGEQLQYINTGSHLSVNRKRPFIKMDTDNDALDMRWSHTIHNPDRRRYRQQRI